MTTHNDAHTVAAQQCGREPDAYEVRCTDGNYEWCRPYHGELEVIMRTGRDRSGKPFEYRALYAAVSPLSTVTPAEVGGLVEWFDTAVLSGSYYGYEQDKFREAASLIQSQAARIAELEGAIREAASTLDWAARRMKGNCSDSDVNAVLLAAGRATFTNEGRDNG